MLINHQDGLSFFLTLLCFLICLKKALKRHRRTQCGVCSLRYEVALNLQNTHKYQIVNYFIRTIYIRTIERREKSRLERHVIKDGVVSIVA